MRMMKRRHAGMGYWTAMLAFMGAAMTTFLASADTLAGHEADDEATAMQVRFEEPEGVARDDPSSSTEEDSARPSNAPALPVDPNAPWRRCGNIGNMMLDLDDLCQYAGAMRATSAAMVSRQ